ncbi:MAG: hypothetical protein HY209_04745 [Candidatus Omnitrophica bacterium]|nr:hypothetical protein [Candidatus Omnitrophota bacterium]
MNTVYFILDPLKAVAGIVYSYIPTVIAVLAVLVIGSLLARSVGKLVAGVLKDLHLDKFSHTTGLDRVLETGGIKRTVSDAIGYVLSWTLLIATFVIALKITGITVLGDMLDHIAGYVPTVATAAVALMIGIILAHIVAVCVRTVAANCDMPKPDLIATFSKWVVVATAFIAFVDKIGLGFLFTGTALTLMTAALALALGLAFGLGGREHAAHYLDKLLKH